MKLSILTPACWERATKLRVLQLELASQISKLPDPKSVEHLVMLDNRTRSVGLKRQALLDSSLGDYVAFVDDDDAVSEDYVASLLKGIESGADVVTFEQEAFVNGKRTHITFGLDDVDEPHIDGSTELKRGVWHVCAIRRSIAIRGIFPDQMDGEDIRWAKQIRPFIFSGHHIPKVLHFYHFSSAGTLATGKDE